MSDVCQGVQFMHQLGIAHLDLKVENILLKKNKFKVADFGSALGQEKFFSWSDVAELSSDERNKAVTRAYGQFEKNTTLMYRPPEMIDQYLKFDVGLKCDIWMLGCVLYVLCFAKHPFMD
jgi:AP2-associated kinase